MRTNLLAFLLTAAVAPGLAWAAGPGGGGGSGTALSAAEIDGLTYMREEEKVAHDVYEVFLAQYGTPIFANIAASEQQHMDAIRTLLTRYGVADPVADNGPGEFTNPDLQALYDQLVAEGGASLVAAFTVGVTIEETDIADITAYLEDVTHRDIQRVYQNLKNASANHLAAFQAQLDGDALCATRDATPATRITSRAGNGRGGAYATVTTCMNCRRAYTRAGCCNAACGNAGRGNAVGGNANRGGAGRMGAVAGQAGSGSLAGSRPFADGAAQKPAQCPLNAIRVEGRITAIDADAGTIVVGDVTVIVAESTIIKQCGRVITFADLAIGQTVAACGVMDGDALVATHVTVKYNGR